LPGVIRVSGSDARIQAIASWMSRSVIRAQEQTITACTLGSVQARPRGRSSLHIARRFSPVNS
jgi:hypothetical protein